MFPQDAFEWIKQTFNHIKRYLKTIVIVLLVSFVSSIICRNPFSSNFPQLKEGDIASRTITTPVNLKIVDAELTEKKRDAAVNQVLVVYDFDPDAKSTLLEKLRKASALLAGSGSLTLDHQRALFEETLSLKLTDNQWQLLKNPHSLSALRKLMGQIMRDLGSSWIVDDSIPPEHNEITLIDIRSAEEFRVSKKAYERKISLLSDIRDFVRSSDKYTLSDIPGLSEKQKEELRILATNLLEIDLSFNQSETKARKDEAVKKVDPVWIEISAGQTIIAEGEKAERRHILILDTLREKNNRLFDLKIAFQFGLFIFTLIFLFYLVGRTNFRKFRLSMRDQWVIGAFFLASLGIIAFLSHLFEAAKHQTIFGPSLIFLLPLAFAGMTLRLFTSMEITNFIVVIFSICVGWMHDSPFIALLTLTTSLAGASRMRHISQRFDVFKAGLIVGGVKALLVILGHGLHLMPSPEFQMEWANYATMISFSVFSGIFSASLVIGIQPLLELVGYTTDLRLMELSSTNHPLLRDLILKAPGTYFHSFTVSQLAEKAAEAIHANALFARVASLYHDIGKTKKPHYFIENVKGDNKHDKLAPTMSALIIANHVKDGIDLGIENQLPPSIIEVIPQHHGTMLISYFYDKAKKLADHSVAVDDRDFRYPGPKPQTREGAIIMLADAVEATAKSATTKTADQMRQVVHQTIQRFFLDGQLDECELTLKDLNSIAQAFLQVLMGVYHQRIEYSHLKEGKDPLEERTTSQISVIKPLR